jgi:hypothetical protein
MNKPILSVANGYTCNLNFVSLELFSLVVKFGKGLLDEEFLKLKKIYVKKNKRKSRFSFKGFSTSFIFNIPVI